MKKVELLAPAGNYEALLGAVNAGADAVYLGGEQYGARAYADNFSRDEIISGIRLAHIYHKKIYLTINTLVKERELEGLYDFLLPLYEAGLDGVIIQDLGVLAYVKRYFPGLELHASTQMTLTGCEGVSLLKEYGVSRVVPARELSLEEIKKLKQTGTEVEIFIHGAMCYCYSGQCLFSSILGGRSGNRGRCAQPCRLPYEINGGKECFPLSMRDMCTIDLLPELIKSGVDSFKIEGRMKKPSYVAGVTAIYRKYIDQYYEQGGIHVSAKDRQLLSSLYIRSRIGDGYFHRHNGRELLTLDSPAYSETAPGILAEIADRYVHAPEKVPVDAQVELCSGKPARLCLRAKEAVITCEGEIVQEAQRQPLQKEKIEQQIRKSGASLLRIQEIELKTQGQVFLPIGAINDLRRKTVFAMEDKLIAAAHREAVPYDSYVQPQRQRLQKRSAGESRQKPLEACISTWDQFDQVIDRGLYRIYLDSRLLSEKEILQKKLFYKKGSTQIYGSTPYIVREKDYKTLFDMRDSYKEQLIQGILIRNLESLAILQDDIAKKDLELDHGIYVWNHAALDLLSGRASGICLPVELNKGEWEELITYGKHKMRLSAVVYGRLPMMITANCLQKTSDGCCEKSGTVMLKDRYGKEFPVYHDCRHCYNIVYNSVPLSLHRAFSEELQETLHCRLDFTVETAQECRKVTEYFQKISVQYEKPFYSEYTTGHYKRGVE